jgi:hypothetical protein
VGLGIAVVTLGALGACKVSASAKSPAFGEAELELEVDPISNTGTVPSNPDLPEGTCVQITFYGPGGAAIGTTTTAAGSSFEIPEGAESAELGDCPEEPEKKDKKARRANASSLVAADTLHQFPFTILPVNFTGPRHSASFWVTAQTQDEADLIKEDFILEMLNEPPPTSVKPEGVHRVTVNPDSSVLVEMFSAGQPQSLSFRWNGMDLFDLDDATTSFQNGWHVTSVSVPSSLVQIDLAGVSENSFEYRIQMPSREIASETRVVVTQ